MEKAKTGKDSEMNKEPKKEKAKPEKDGEMKKEAEKAKPEAAKTKTEEEMKEELIEATEKSAKLVVEKDVIKDVMKDSTVERGLRARGRRDARGGKRGKRGKRDARGRRDAPAFDAAAWKPKTSIGKKVKAGEIKDMKEILDSGQKILEPSIVDVLMPNLETDLLLIGQSKGKFGGGQRRVFKQTQRKSPVGNKPQFSAMAVVGNTDGYVGVGLGKSKDTVPSREKAMRKAKLNVFKVRRGCGSWECNCKTPHSIPFSVSGRCGSVRITIMPAPKGKGLCIEPECAKLLKLAGIKDVWSKTSGQTRIKTNLIKACISALKALNSTKVMPGLKEKLGLIEGRNE